MSLRKKVFNSIIKGIDDQERTLTALVSTGATDRMEEALDPMGVDLKNYRKNPVVLWSHNYEAPPIGKALWVKRTKDGVLSKVQFAPTEQGQEVFDLYKEGFLSAFSVGFIPKKWVDGEEKGCGKNKPRRTFTDWEMLEYSAVPVPANPECLALAMKKGILKDEDLIEEIQKEIDAEGEDNPEENEEPKDPDEETPKTEPLTSQSLGLDEVLADNALMIEKISDLEKENMDLKYKIYELTEKAHKHLSEIAVKNAADKVCDVLDGAFRKAIGKVQ